jgi:hypothetical protein
VTRLLAKFLRWGLGASPSWNLALVRVGANIPAGRFRQPLPIEALDEWGKKSRSAFHSPESPVDGTGLEDEDGPARATGA